MSDDLPYGVDTIVIPFTWANRPSARQLPWMRFGGRRVAANSDRSPLSDTIRAQVSQESPGSPGTLPPVNDNIVTSVVSNDVTKSVPSDAPALDDKGEAIIGAPGLPLRRPATLDPQMFVGEGLKDEQVIQYLLALPGELPKL